MKRRARFFKAGVVVTGNRLGNGKFTAVACVQRKTGWFASPAKARKRCGVSRENHGSLKAAVGDALHKLASSLQKGKR